MGEETQSPDTEQLPVVVKATELVGMSDVVGAGVGSGVGRGVGIADTVGCSDTVGSDVGDGVGHVLHPAQSQPYAVSSVTQVYP